MKKLLRLILVICIFSFSCFVASCNEERVAVPTDLLFRIETIDVDGVDYAVKRGFASKNVKLVNEKEQLEDYFHILRKIIKRNLFLLLFFCNTNF